MPSALPQVPWQFGLCPQPYGAEVPLRGPVLDNGPAQQHGPRLQST